MPGTHPVIHIALPALNERDYIVHTLECLQKQSLSNFHTWICVNQPESFHDIAEKQHICQNNAQTLQLLSNYPLPNLHVIDRSSKGKGWQEGKLGVGMARKTIMDRIADHACHDDIILCMDADTTFGENYLGTVQQQFQENPDALGLANPYFHPLKQEPKLDRAMLRYEIYMRYYALNMRFTGSPYYFTPLGSAMGCTVKAYKKINGLTAKKSGEDFYFIQKLVKAGRVMMYNTEWVYPGNRLSDRVFFGTGPAMIKGVAGQWSAYPLFNPELFEQVKTTIRKFPQLFYEDLPVPMSSFLSEHFRSNDIFAPLRKNHKTQEGFVKACHEKVDGLRILQYVKTLHALNPKPDETNLKWFLDSYFPQHGLEKALENLNFSQSGVDILNKIRNFLFTTELKLQKDEHAKASNPI